VPTERLADCIFCRIARDELAAERVYEDASVIGFKDVNPQAPVHVLVMPRQHVSSVAELVGDPELAGRLLAAAARVAAEQGLVASGYRIATNHGRDGSQSVDHLHLHVLGGRPLSGQLG
jgi:histidine triad (HIT) family protein